MLTCVLQPAPWATARLYQGQEGAKPSCEIGLVIGTLRGLGGAYGGDDGVEDAADEAIHGGVLPSTWRWWCVGGWG